MSGFIPQIQIKTARVYGSKEARKASEDWIDELELMTCLEKSMPWRRISVRTAAKLASRVRRAER